MITKKKKIRKFKSLAITLAITSSSLIIVVLLIVSSLLMYFSFQAQQKVLIAHQQLIAQNAANTVENFIRDKFRILEVIASRSKLAIMHREERKPVLEKLLGLEPIFRQLVLFNVREEELVRVSRVSKILAEKSMKYKKRELFSKVYRNEKFLSSIYIDEITSEPMVVMAIPVTDVFGEYKEAIFL